MITIAIFFILTLIEALIIWIKIQELEDAQKLGNEIASALGINEEYPWVTRVVTKIIEAKKKWKHLIWIPISLVLMVNVIIAAIIHFIITIALPSL